MHSLVRQILRQTIRLISLSVTAAAVAAGATAVSAAAAVDTGSVHAAGGSVYSITDRLAWQLATTLPDDAGLLTAAAGDPVTLSGGTGNAALDQAVRLADRAVLSAKGLPADGTPLLQLRLAHPDMRAALATGTAPVIAAAPTDDNVTAVTAYDLHGDVVTLDATVLPQRPVFVVDVDIAKALPMGLNVIKTTLDARGITGAEPAAATTSGYWATKVRSVRLSDDKEPWVKGAAEIFGIAGGFGLDGHVKVNTVTMPYLDHDGTTYYPNQLIVHFSAYKYNLADFVMMEDDGDTNYLSLAQALTSALLTIIDQGAYIPLVNAILNAMPGSWWTDDPDYVDSWYTLTTSSSGRLNGAAANGWMDLAPYWVAPL